VNKTGIRSAGGLRISSRLVLGNSARIARAWQPTGRTTTHMCRSQLDPTLKTPSSVLQIIGGEIRHIEYAPRLALKFVEYHSFRTKRRPKCGRRADQSWHVVALTGAARIDPGQLWSWRPAFLHHPRSLKIFPTPSLAFCCELRVQLLPPSYIVPSSRSCKRVLLWRTPVGIGHVKS